MKTFSINDFWSFSGILILSFLLLSPLQALVIDVGDGQGNTSAPLDDFGFGSVGIRGDATAVYLGAFNGEYWVISASHVTGGNIILNGQTYNWVSGSTVQLNDPVTGEKSDLILFRLQSAPEGLSNLNIATSPISNGQDLFIVGSGRTRLTNKSYWSVSGGVWTEESGPGPSIRSGYKTSNARALRWGENSVNWSGELVLGSGENQTTQRAFRTLFTDGTAQGVYGDSGGGAFYQDDEGKWWLGGITLATSSEAGQPSNTAILNSGNYTYFVDLGYYSDQIYAIIPEPRAIAFIGAFLWLALGIAIRQRYLQNKDH